MWWLAVPVMLLVTIVIYGMASTIFKMSFGTPQKAISQERFNILNYAGQFVFIAVLCLLGIYMPKAVSDMITAAAGQM
jgi:hypothetical protein